MSSQHPSLLAFLFTDIRGITRNGNRTPQLIAHAEEIPGAVAWYQGDVATAPLLAEAAAIYKTIQNQQCAGHCLQNAAGWAAKSNKPEEAVTLFAAATALRKDTGIPTPEYGRFVYEEVFEDSRASLGERLDQVWQAGASMSMDEALDHIIEVTSCEQD